jgi:hypothetical protein
MIMHFFKEDSPSLIDAWTKTGNNNPEVLSVTGSRFLICGEGGFERQCQIIMRM